MHRRKSIRALKFQSDSPFVPRVGGAAIKRRPMCDAVRIATVAFALTGASLAPSSYADTSGSAVSAPKARQYNVPAGPLSAALNTLADQANVLISVPSELTAGKVSKGVSGAYAVDDAFRKLLSGTGLEALRQGDGTYSLRQASATTPVDELATVVVVGQRAEEDVTAPYAGGQVAKGGSVGLLGDRGYMDTPYSVTSYTEKLIRDEQSTSIAELLTTTDPSVRAAIDTSNRYDALTIRGLRVENDEMSLNGLYGLVPDYRVGPDPVERVDILKGPGAFLNGMMPQGSVGGSVNIVTKRADDTPLNRLTAEYFSNSVFGAHADIGRRFGPDNAFGIRINAAHREGDTEIDEQTRRNNALSLGLDYRGERLRVSGDVIYQQDYMQAQARGYTPVAGIAMPGAPDPKINLAQDYSFSDAHSLTAMGKVEYDLTSNVTLFGQIGANRFGYDKLEDPGATMLNVQGDARSTTKYQQGQSHAVSAEAGVRAKVSTGPVAHELVFTVDNLQQTTWFGQTAYGTYLTNIYAPVRLDSLGAPTSMSPEAKDSSQTLRSVAVADTMSAFNGRVQLTFGVRRQEVDSSNYATSGTQTYHYDQSATTPSVALVIRPMEQLSFYTNYIEALTPGSSPPADAANPNAVFAPYKSKQYEIGSKLDLGHFGATLSVFRIKVPSGIVDPVTKIYSVDGEQRNQGIELSGFGEVVPRVRLIGGATWLDAKLERTQNSAYDGNHAVGAPSFQANVGAEWDTPFIPGFTVTGRLIYTGEAYVSQDNTQSVPSWTRMDLGGRYTTKVAGKDITVRATVTNLFNRYYWQANPTGYVISGMPRTFWVSASADF